MGERVEERCHDADAAIRDLEGSDSWEQEGWGGGRGNSGGRSQQCLGVFKLKHLRVLCPLLT